MHRAKTTICRGGARRSGSWSGWLTRSSRAGADSRSRYPQILAAAGSVQTETGTVTAGNARTILVTVLKSVANDHPQQTLEQWLRGAEATLPSVAKQLYPALNQDDVQLPLLLDFAKHTFNPGPVRQ